MKFPLKTFLHSVLHFSSLHKFISTVGILTLLGGGYWLFHQQTITGTSYITAQVTKGTIVVSVTGTGQVSASNQVDVKAKASGNIVYLGVSNAQEVRAGTLIAQVDTRDALQAVKDAEVNLSQVKLTLEKMKGLTTSDGTLRGSKEKNADDLKKAYEDGFNTVVNTFLQLPDIMTGLQDMLYSSTMGISGQWNIDYYLNAISQYELRALQFKNDTTVAYEAARKAYDKNLSDYKASSRFSTTNEIEQLINQTYETTRLIAESVKNYNNLIQLYKDTLVGRNIRTSTIADTHLSQLSSYTSKTNTQLSNLLSIKNAIQSGKETSITVAFDIADQEIRVTQAENTLTNAKERLADCYVYAPFSGIVAKLNVEKGDDISSGGSIATFITKQRLAQITLNEVDIAKVKVGQKATLTFDAVSDLSIVGKVTNIDTLGTATQGVVNYAVQVGFDTETDTRVKPGMSVSTSIITDVKQDVLVVPNSAIKVRDTEYYVDTLNIQSAGTQGIASSIPPTGKIVVIGIANDTETEIISGLSEGENVVTRTITAQTTATQATAPSLFGGGGGVRIQRGN
ncbi:MAG: efflux RND transporter periplasmic adaptor subunit [Candidatus Paceibacterota bacterium]|jgi:HlyD family secretion protein